MEKNNPKRIIQVLDTDAALKYAVELYGEWAFVQSYQKLKKSELGEIIKTVQKECAPKGIYLKRRYKTKLPHTSLIDGEKAPKEFVVVENDYKFIIKAEDNLDIGLFLDHRISREVIRDYSRGKSVLNLFAYTGSFSVYAAQGCANRVVSVDLSKTYCKWAEKNFDLNNLTASQSEVWQMDVFEYIDMAIGSGEKFDVIVLDPPTFSRSKSGVWKVQEDHADLIRKLQNKLLTNAGFLFFSTNYSEFRLDRYIAPGADKMTKKTIPEEFKPLTPHKSFIFYN